MGRRIDKRDWRLRKKFVLKLSRIRVKLAAFLTDVVRTISHDQLITGNNSTGKLVALHRLRQLFLLRLINKSQISVT